MSSLIQPAVQGPAVGGVTAPPRAPTSSTGVQQGPIAPADEPVSLDTIPSTPPPEVLAQMQDASAGYEALQAKGYEIHYVQDSRSRRVSAELRDAKGTLLRTLTPSEAVSLAAGEPLTEE